jgi:hypothetical protein
MAKKNRPTPVCSPLGIASFPWLNRPDISVWNNGVKVGEDAKKGKYKVTLLLSKDDPKAQAFIERIKEEYTKAVASELARLTAAAKEKGQSVQVAYDKFFDKKGEFREASYPFRTHKEDETQWAVSFSMNAQYTKKGAGDNGADLLVKIAPGLWTADLKKWPKDKVIGGGSEIIVSFVFNPYSMANNGAGVSLQMQDVQVIKCKAFGERSAAQAGFQRQEGEVPSDDDAGDTGFSSQGGGDDVPPPGDDDAPPADRQF